MSLLWLLLMGFVVGQQMADEIQTAANPKAVSSYVLSTVNTLMDLGRLSIQVITEEDVIETDMIASLSIKADFNRIYQTPNCVQQRSTVLQPFGFTQPLDAVQTTPRHFVFKQISVIVAGPGISSLSLMASLSRYQPTSQIFDISFVYGSIFVDCKQQYRPEIHTHCARYWKRFWRMSCWDFLVWVPRPLYPDEIVYIKDYMHYLTGLGEGETRDRAFDR